MPRIRRHHIPPALFRHLLDRIQRRKILLLSLNPRALARHRAEVPEGDWFKRFQA